MTNAAHVCQRPPTGSDYFYVKSGGYSQTADPITSPSLTSTDWDGYYSNSTISRLSPCAAGGLASTSFDNDTTRNTSLTTAFNLTPGTNYTCQTKNANGFVIGELDWDATNHILSVRGTVFIDGNVTINGLVKYRGMNKYGTHPSGSDGSDGLGGMMVMYVSGTVSLSNNGVFCGWNTTNDTAAYSGSSCDFNAWTPGTSMFMFVAHGGVTLNQSSYFQGASFTPGNVSVGQSSQTEGPMIAGTMSSCSKPSSRIARFSWRMLLRPRTSRGSRSPASRAPHRWRWASCSSTGTSGCRWSPTGGSISSAFTFRPPAG